MRCGGVGQGAVGCSAGAVRCSAGAVRCSGVGQGAMRWGRAQPGAEPPLRCPAPCALDEEVVEFREHLGGDERAHARALLDIVQLKNAIALV